MVVIKGDNWSDILLCGVVGVAGEDDGDFSEAKALILVLIKKRDPFFNLISFKWGNDSLYRAIEWQLF